MITSHSRRLFESGTANTLAATTPAQITTDSRFPFEADDGIAVPIDGDRLVGSSDSEQGDTG